MLAFLNLSTAFKGSRTTLLLRQKNSSGTNLFCIGIANELWGGRGVGVLFILYIAHLVPVISNSFS
uniref:Uncharacterized protein n=1 Tax=Anguilla anguilla TaxID=7936 RepID=A0A0E9S3V6_ANGAN